MWKRFLWLGLFSFFPILYQIILGCIMYQQGIGKVETFVPFSRCFGAHSVTIVLHAVLVLFLCILHLILSTKVWLNSSFHLLEKGEFTAVKIIGIFVSSKKLVNCNWPVRIRSHPSCHISVQFITNFMKSFAFRVFDVKNCSYLVKSSDSMCKFFSSILKHQNLKWYQWNISPMVL